MLYFFIVRHTLYCKFYYQIQKKSSALLRLPAAIMASNLMLCFLEGVGVAA
jgi:hypothetical protein